MEEPIDRTTRAVTFEEITPADEDNIYIVFYTSPSEGLTMRMVTYLGVDEDDGAANEFRWMLMPDAHPYQILSYPESFTTVPAEQEKILFLKMENITTAKRYMNDPYRQLLLNSYTSDEIRNMTELPELPDSNIPSSARVAPRTGGKFFRRRKYSTKKYKRRSIKKRRTTKKRRSHRK